MDNLVMGEILNWWKRNWLLGSLESLTILVLKPPKPNPLPQTRTIHLFNKHLYNNSLMYMHVTALVGSCNSNEIILTW